MSPKSQISAVRSASLESPGLLGRVRVKPALHPSNDELKDEGEVPLKCPQLGDSSAGIQGQGMRFPSLSSLSLNPLISYGSTNVNEAV